MARLSPASEFCSSSCSQHWRRRSVFEHYLLIYRVECLKCGMQNSGHGNEYRGCNQAKCLAQLMSFSTCEHAAGQSTAPLISQPFVASQKRRVSACVGMHACAPVRPCVSAVDQACTSHFPRDIHTASTLKRSWWLATAFFAAEQQPQSQLWTPPAVRTYHGLDLEAGFL